MDDKEYYKELKESLTPKARGYYKRQGLEEYFSWLLIDYEGKQYHTELWRLISPKDDNVVEGYRVIVRDRNDYPIVQVIREKCPNIDDLERIVKDGLDEYYEEIYND